MDIRYLHHSEIDYSKWEDCVCCSLNACVFGHAWFLDIMQSNWGAVVLDDYVAVMPVLFKGQDFVMPKYMFWTGVYTAEFLDEDVYGQFLKVITDRFRFVNIRFDKFFKIPEKTIGQVRPHNVYQLEVIHDMKNRICHSTKQMKAYIMQSADEGIYCERVMSPLSVEVFTRFGIKATFDEIDVLQRVINEALRRKACVQFQFLDKDKRQIGYIVALLVENYIFVPFLVYDKNRKSKNVQFMLLYNLLAFLDGCPGVLVLSPGLVGLSRYDLYMMQTKPFYTNTLHIGRLSRLMNIFNRK